MDRLVGLQDPLAGLRVRVTVRVVPLFGLSQASYAVTAVIHDPPLPTVTLPEAQDTEELENWSCVAVPAATVTEDEPERVPSVAARVAVSAANSLIDAVPTPEAKVTVAG
jgi:hypothetical protein